MFVLRACWLSAILAGVLGAPQPPKSGACKCAEPSAPKTAPVPETLASVQLLATGDIMMHEAVKATAADLNARDAAGKSLNHEGFDALFAAVAPELKAADIAFGNLEFPVAPKAGRGTRSFVFNAPPIALEAVRAAGFRVVSFANNHAFDQGRAGVAETVQNILSAGLAEVGAGRNRAEAEKPLVQEIHGIKVGFLGFTARFNQNLDSDDAKEPRVNPAEAQAMLTAIAALRKQADFVIVSIHWGTEYASAPADDQIELAHQLVDGGADLILGSHPHVLQPLELYPAADGRLALIAYSLGNFVSNQSRTFAPGISPPSQGDTRDGVLLAVSIVKRRYLSGLPKVELGPVSYLPLWTENNALARARAPKTPARIGVIEIDRALDQANAALALEVARKSPDSAEVVRQQRRIALLMEQRQRTSERLGADFLALQPAVDTPKGTAAGPSH